MTFVKVFFSVTRLGHKFSYKRSPNICNCWAIWKNITFKYNLLWLLFGNVWNILATFDADIRSQLSLAFCHLGQLFLSTPFICFFLCKGTQYIIDTPMPCTEYINRVDVYLKVLLHTSFLLHSLVYGGFSCQWVFYPFFFFILSFLNLQLFIHFLIWSSRLKYIKSKSTKNIWQAFLTSIFYWSINFHTFLLPKLTILYGTRTMYVNTFTNLGQ